MKRLRTVYRDAFLLECLPLVDWLQTLCSIRNHARPPKFEPLPEIRRRSSSAFACQRATETACDHDYIIQKDASWDEGKEREKQIQEGGGKILPLGLTKGLKHRGL